MAYQEVILKLIVKDGEVEQATKEIEKLGHEVQKVEKGSKKTGDTLEKSFDNASRSADNLKGGAEGIVAELLNIVKSAKLGGAAMRAALISTGIGALVVALGLVVANWDKISDAIGLTDHALQDLIDTQNRQIDNLDYQLKLLKEQEKTSLLLGESTVENKKQQEEQLALLQLTNNERLEALKLQLQKEASTAVELSIWQKILKAAAGGFGGGVVSGVSDEERSRLDDINKQIQDATLRSESLKQALIEINQPEKAKGGAAKRTKATAVDAGLESGLSDPYNEQKQLDALRAQALQEGTEEFREFQNEANLAEVTAFFETEKAKTAITADEQHKRTLEEEEGARIRIAQAQAEADAKAMFQMQLAGITANALGTISQLFEEGTAASKTAAIAEIIIGTGMGFIQGLDIAQKGAKAAGPAAPFAFPIFYATQVAAVLSAAAQAKNILSKVKGGDSGGSFGAPSGGGGAPSAPSFNVVGTSGVNQLAQTLGNDDTPVRAYVVSGDVTNAQSLDRNIEETSTI